MPNFAIVDSHTHIWDPELFCYPWHAQFPKLNRPFLSGDYFEQCDDIEVESFVFLEGNVKPGQRQAEAEWVTEQAENEQRIRAIVASVPLEKGEAAEADLQRVAQIPLVRGVRRDIHDEPDNEFCVRQEFVAGIKLLPSFGLTFDICALNQHMANVVELVRQCPDVTFNLNDIGMPDIKNGMMNPWKEDLRVLAAMPNVHCKMSGLVSLADHADWTREDLKPYIDHVIECFGFGRVMYGSDWPVSTLAAKYPEWIRTLDWTLTGCSEDELRRLYRENAIAFYRLH